MAFVAQNVTTTTPTSVVVARYMPAVHRTIRAAVEISFTTIESNSAATEH